MSFSQSYSIPTVQKLLEKLTGINAVDLLKDYAEKKGIIVENLEEDWSLDESDLFDVLGAKVTLKDGRVFIPKKVKSECWDGNTGLDTYEWKLIDEEVGVEFINHDDECEIDYPEGV